MKTPRWIRRALCWVFGHPRYDVEAYVTDIYLGPVSFSDGTPIAIAKCSRCEWRPTKIEIKLENTATGETVVVGVPDRRGRMRFEEGLRKTQDGAQAVDGSPLHRRPEEGGGAPLRPRKAEGPERNAGV